MNRWFATTDEKAFFRRVSYTRLWPFLQLRCFAKEAWFVILSRSFPAWYNKNSSSVVKKPSCLMNEQGQEPPWMYDSIKRKR